MVRSTLYFTSARLFRFCLFCASTVIWQYVSALESILLYMCAFSWNLLFLLTKKHLTRHFYFFTSNRVVCCLLTTSNSIQFTPTSFILEACNLHIAHKYISTNCCIRMRFARTKSLFVCVCVCVFVRQAERTTWQICTFPPFYGNTYHLWENIAPWANIEIWINKIKNKSVKLIRF